MGDNEHHHQVQGPLPTFTFDQHEHHHDHKQHEHKKQHYPKGESSDNDCCSKGIILFNVVSKTITQEVEIVPPDFFPEFTNTGFNTDIVSCVNIEEPIEQLFVRSHHPPRPDIRIAIQSFQI